MDCHLMVTNPEDYVEPLKEAGAGMFTFHIEATEDAAALADKARAAGKGWHHFSRKLLCSQHTGQLTTARVRSSLLSIS
jgi:hypothetical protein